MRFKAGRPGSGIRVVCSDRERIMEERPPRRANNIMLSAEQLDRNASMARSLNRRANNRLKLRKGSLDGHRSTNLHSLNYEMRRIKHELKEITHTSGHYDIGSDVLATTDKNKEKTKRARSKRATSFKESSKAGPTLGDLPNNSRNYQDQTQQKNASKRKSLSLPTLPSVSDSAEPTKQSVKVDGSGMEIFTPRAVANPKTSIARKNSRKDLARDSTTLSSSAARISVSVTNVNGDTERLGPPMKGAQKNDPSIANLNVDAAKDRIHNRLSQNAVDDEEADIIPFMNVPPDGLPRTVYLLPPLTDLLDEAKKARYLRRPKKPLQPLEMDDPERELGIDEIFSKKS